MLELSSSLLGSDHEQISALVQHPRNFVGIMLGEESISSRGYSVGLPKNNVRKSLMFYLLHYCDDEMW